MSRRTKTPRLHFKVIYCTETMTYTIKLRYLFFFWRTIGYADTSKRATEIIAQRFRETAKGSDVSGRSYKSYSGRSWELEEDQSPNKDEKLPSTRNPWTTTGPQQ